MEHYTQDLLLGYYFNELDIDKARPIKQHLEDCNLCQSNIHEFDQLARFCSILKASSPSSSTFDKIAYSIKNKPVSKSQTLKSQLIPYAYITLMVLFCFSGIHFLHETVASMPIIRDLRPFIFSENLGSLEITLLLFFSIGSLASASILPPLILETQRQNSSRTRTV